MTDQPAGAPDVVVRVLRDLRVIENLASDTVVRTEPIPLGAPEPRPAGFIGPMPEAFRRVRVTMSQLLTQAVMNGNDPEIPGGDAMVALAHVANADWWQHRLDEAEENAQALSWRTGEPTKHPEVYDDDEWEPPLQTLRFWSDRWRAVHDMVFQPTPKRPRQTIASEVNFLRWAIDPAYDREPPEQFRMFVRDVARARTRVENVLRAGVRSERGVPCLYDECRGIRLVRKLVPTRDEDGNKVWYYSKWHCPRCHRAWTDDEYVRMVTAATEAAKIEQIPGLDDDGPGDTWCSIEYAARRTGRPAVTIRVWAHRGRVPTVCLLAGRRRGYVRLADVDEQHQIAARRAEAVRAGKRRRANHTRVV
jgi:hypothetical protein